MTYGLIGEKLSHSFSKEIHEQIGNYHYDLISLNKDEFHQFMVNKNFKAINVTIPYKKDVIGYLDEIDPYAQAINAVNTIINDHGKLKGYNTDYFGFKYTIHKYQVNMKDKKVLIIGDGGASAAIQLCVKNEHPAQIIIANRSVKPHCISLEDAQLYHRDAQIIINTTPVGMYPNLIECPIQIELFKNCEMYMDLIYNPLNTLSAIRAKNNQISACCGLEMLVAQAKYAVELFLNKTINDDIIEQIVNDINRAKRNIVLIGMPSCGKSTIAKMLGKKLSMKVIDLDQFIEKKANRLIKDIINIDGEAYFRDLETLATIDICKQNNVIISCGGGIIKKAINMDYLRLNGTIYFIDRNLDLLICDDDNRPLSSSKEALEQLYKQRYDIYKLYSDHIIENNTNIDDCIDKIIETL